MRLVQRILGITLLALCAVLAGLLIYRGAHRGPSAAAAAHTAPAPAASGLAPSALQGSLAAGASGSAVPVPEMLPDIRVPNLAGNEVPLRDYLGHPLIVNFWATWCAPCRREMPLLQQLWRRNRAEGLQIVGIAVDSRDAVNQFLRQTAVSYPLLVGEDEGTAAAASFGIEPVLPFSVFADARGQIIAVKIGELHPAEADYILSAMQQVAQGHESLPQARAAIAAELRQLAIQRAQSASSEDPAAGIGAAISADR